MVNFSFRARAKKVPKVESSSTTFLLGSFQRVLLLSKMGKSHSRPEQLSNIKDSTNNGTSNLVSSKHQSASKNSIVSESEIKIQQNQQNGSRLASNTSQQTIKEAATEKSKVFLLNFGTFRNDTFFF